MVTTEIINLNNLKNHFIDFIIEQQVLKFGNFTIKSGRQSPYFFNLGAFNTGASLKKLGEFYAAMIQTINIPYDVLFGPAYKGIPLVSATSIALASNYQLDVPYCFNRKVKKQYAEGGEIVGAPLAGNVLMLDDVISAGTTVRETLHLMQQYNAQLCGILIAFNRQEKAQGEISAIQEVFEQYQIPIYSIITLEDVICYLKKHPELYIHISHIEDYKQKYGA